MKPPSDRAAWLSQAACRGSNPGDFDIVANVSSATPPPKRLDRMWGQGAICEACPVVRECAADALTAGDQGVIRGGVPLSAHCDLAWRRMERTALRAMSESDDPAETRRVWQVAAHRTAAKRRTEKSAA
ncbi:WhiB family transcriptional regulator [Corynebacterium glyciniphilum]|uniref:WhiB family transcriptional regulator n=1 Tax=Corynebacterium glyciniphilum TaxID=1404244 RepID=UPI003FD3EFC5